MKNSVLIHIVNKLFDRSEKEPAGKSYVVTLYNCGDIIDEIEVGSLVELVCCEDNVVCIKSERCDEEIVERYYDASDITTVEAAEIILAEGISRTASFVSRHCIRYE